MTLVVKELTDAVQRTGPVVRVLVAGVHGSAPREVGAAMLVGRTGRLSGTIGGGPLEWEATLEAEALLADRQAETLVRRIALGPALGLPCGGAVTLVFERFDATRIEALRQRRDLWLRPVAADAPAVPPPALLHRAESAERPPAPVLDSGWILEAIGERPTRLVIYGAGHVGRAVASVAAPLPGFEITLVDVAEARLPAPPPEGVRVRVVGDPAAYAARRHPAALHLVMTHDPALDLAICDAVLRRGFGFLGVIGSATKASHFRQRLSHLGHPADRVARLACPIGDPALGKHPQAIAIGVVAGLLRGRAGVAPKAARAGVIGR